MKNRASLSVDVLKDRSTSMGVVERLPGKCGKVIAVIFIVEGDKRRKVNKTLS